MNKLKVNLVTTGNYPKENSIVVIEATNPENNHVYCEWIRPRQDRQIYSIPEDYKWVKFNSHFNWEMREALDPHDAYRDFTEWCSFEFKNNNTIILLTTYNNYLFIRDWHDYFNSKIANQFIKTYPFKTIDLTNQNLVTHLPKFVRGSYNSLLERR